MADQLYLDTETYNEADISVGTYKYAETAEVMLLSYAWNDDPAHVIDFTDPDGRLTATEIMLRRVATGGTFEDVFGDTIVIAHNSMFDRNVMRLGDMKVEIPIERWRDTMVQAYCHALPGGLDQLAKVLGLPQEQQKLAEGKALIRRFCKPAPRNHKADRYDRHSHPEEWARFVEYARQDIVTMRECAKRMPTWNWSEVTIAEWHLDQKINDRGFKVDMDLAYAGAQAAIDEKERLHARFAELTDGLSPGQHKAILDYINENYYLGLESSAKEVLLPLTKDESLPAELRELCQLKCDANKTSTAKYGAIAAATSSDGRFRGGLQFAGASRTRRWAGRVFQPQNLPSRGLPEQEQIASYIDALKLGAHDLLFEDLMLFGAAALRGLVTT